MSIIDAIDMKLITGILNESPKNNIILSWIPLKPKP